MPEKKEKTKKSAETASVKTLVAKKKPLEKRGYNWKETYKDMKELLNRAVELKILPEKDEERR